MAFIICNCILYVVFYKKKNETVLIKNHLQPKAFSFNMQSCSGMC